MIDEQKLEMYRGDTPHCEDIIHLNNAGASLMPLPVHRAISEYLELESSLGGYEAAEKCAEQIEGVYRAAVSLLGGRPENYAYARSATDAYVKALLSIPFQSGDKILTTSNDYVSNYLAFLSLKKRFGIEIHILEDRPDGAFSPEDLERKLDQFNPGLLAITHVPTNSGLIQPVEEVKALLDGRDTLFLLDACQSVGQLPVNAIDLGCDFLTSTMRKFLRGPRGSGLLYVSDRVIDLELEPVGLDMRGASWYKPDDYKLKGNARHFEEWEQNFALVLGAKAALEYARTVGPENIAKRNSLLRFHLIDGLAQIKGLKLLETTREGAGIITFHPEKANPLDIKRALRQRHINIAFSPLEAALIDFQRKGVPGAIRVSPHYYNTFRELDIFLEALDGILNSLSNPG